MKIKALLRLSVLSLALLISSSIYADWGIFNSFVIIDQGAGNVYYDAASATGNPDFQGFYFGNLTSASTFLLDGAEIQTFKDNNSGTSNVCGGDIYYRVYRSCDTPGSFLNLDLPFDISLGGNDQQWAETAGAINLLAGLEPGKYTLEIYIEAEGNQTNSSGCGEYKYVK